VTVPQRLVRLGERRRFGDAGVVDEDVDRTELCGDGGDGLRDSALVGDVEDERERSGAAAPTAAAADCT
jgi:hypothetical protein